MTGKEAAPKKAAAKKPAAKKPAHPTYQIMVVEAIKELKERKGASRQALKKYIASEYKVENLSNHVFNTALKKLVEAGTIVVSENGARWKIKKVEAAPKKKPVVKKWCYIPSEESGLA